MIYAFREEGGLSGETALKIACGLGAGMGEKGKVCGAITGGILILGMRYGRGDKDKPFAEERTYSKTRELIDKFSEKHGTVICRRLLKGCDLTTEEGKKFFKENDLFNKICLPCVQSAVALLEDNL